jgi:CheY-like chemotaxis protein
MDILCVGPEPALLKIIARIFERLGFLRVITVDTVAEAWAALEQGRFEMLVIGGVKMDGMLNGELIRRVRATPTLRKLPIMLITGYTLYHPSQIPDYFYMVNAFVPKPFSCQEFSQDIKAAFYNRSGKISADDIYNAIMRNSQNASESARTRFTQRWYGSLP